ncbi:MAG TPA: histidine kinase [Candidatus Pullilachnospira intestinigallinarum]|nr:histidine kinase [Candidatus Pullilachnospira intestinigallinarum]
MTAIKKIISRDSLQRKLILYIVVVVAFLIGISSMFSSFYFSKVTRQRLMRDYTELLNYSSAQLENFYEEMIQYSIVIASDKSLQEILAKGKKPMDEVLKKYRINEILKPYATLNNNLISVEIQTSDGIVYSSETANRTITRMDEIFWKDIWEKDAGFLGKRTIFNANKERTVVSFVLPMNNYYDNVQDMAILILNISYEKFEERLKGNLSDFNWVFLRSGQGDTIYFQGKEEIDEESASRQLEQGEEKRTDVWTDDHEIVLCSKSLAGNMTLAISMTDENIQEEIQAVHYFFGSLFLAALLVCAAGICLVTVRVTASIKKLTAAAREISEGKKQVSVEVKGNDEVAVLADVFNDMVKSVEQQMVQIQRTEKEKNQLKMDILMAQINPHFIYNTLNSAIYLSKMGENGKVESLIRAFVHLLQDNMKSGADGMIARVEEEEECIRNYLAIQAIRYPGRFESRILVDDTIRKRNIPRLILQPFVENSLNHGILTEERKGEIFISIQEQKGWIRILIRDNGVGMDQKALDKVMRFEKTREAGFTHSIGISNINERLKLMYKEEYRLRMDSNPDKGMTVELMLPLEFGRKEKMDEKDITD